MAKKKSSAKKAEVIPAVNLTGTTKLDFALNKADIIDFYCADQEEQLEEQINQVARELSVADEEVRTLEAALFGEQDEDGEWSGLQVIKDTVLKKHGKTVDKVKKALEAMQTARETLESLGGKPKRARRKRDDDKELVTVRVYLLEGASRRYGGRYTAQRVSLFTTNRKARKTLKGYRRQLGKNVPDSKLHDLSLGQCFWQQYSSSHTAAEKVWCRVSVDSEEGTFSSGDLEVPIPAALKKKVDAFVAAHKTRAPLIKKLHDLLIKHAELPQMKKQIKKAVVGRVLQNTEEGKLMLAALKGIKKASTRLLTDAAANIE